jgi:GTP cyclohydrolase I
VLNGYARRLQVQERLTAEVADCIWDNLQHPHGVRTPGAVVIDAQHGCMTGRGVRTPGRRHGDEAAAMLRLLPGDDQRSRKEVLSELMGY